MYSLIKQCFFTSLAFLTGVNALNCVSMNNQECKIKPQIINVNGDDPLFFPSSIKISKCSSSSNNINNPCAKLCVPDVVKNLNVKVFNLVSGTNETRCIDGMKCVTVNVDLRVMFVIISNVGIMINSGVM